MLTRMLWVMSSEEIGNEVAPDGLMKIPLRVTGALSVKTGE